MARRIRAREVLRLRSVNGLSQNAIARTAHVSKHSVQDWYNNFRIHSTLGYMSPVEFREAGLSLPESSK